MSDQCPVSGIKQARMDSDIESIKSKKSKKRRIMTERRKVVKSLKKLSWKALENPEWLNSIKNVAKSADDQVTMILMAVQPREIFYDKANTAEQKLKDLILKNFPESSNAMIIGCTANKVALKCSNVDIFIKFDNLFYVDVKKRLNEIQNLIINLPEDFQEVKIIDSSVPRLQFKSSDISFSLNFTEEEAPYESILIADFLSMDEKIKNMVIIIRYWIKCVESTCNKFRLGSSTICFLVLFYFQEKHGFDPICDYINYRSESIYGGWFCKAENYLKNYSVSYLKKIPIAALVRDFFDYYSVFNFKSFVICPYVGKMLEKKKMTNPHYLPRAYSSYIDDLQLEPTWKSSFDSALCIQHPFLHRINVTEDLDNNAVDYFIKALGKASSAFAENKEDNVFYSLFAKELNNN